MKNILLAKQLSKFMLVSLILFCLVSQPARGQSVYSNGKASFAVSINKLLMPYRIMTISVLPDSNFVIVIGKDFRTGNYSVESMNLSADSSSAYRWVFKSPKEIGLYRLKIIRDNPRDFILLNVFVIMPLTEAKNGYLNKYRIGFYPKVPYKKLPVYKPPTGFIEYREEYDTLSVSPHFKLKQFLCKQSSASPKYLIVQDKLLLKLEIILEEMNRRGYDCNGFNILSGFRTPFYNESIGNVKYSRHVWGGAADIFIDENPKDDMMDDLNRDGVINWKDAKTMYSIIDEMSFEEFWEPYLGGLGQYKKTPSRGPFVHVDVRGRRARWGD